MEMGDYVFHGFSLTMGSARSAPFGDRVAAELAQQGDYGREGLRHRREAIGKGFFRFW